MIVSSKRERYDGKFRLVLYRTDEQGRCQASLTKGDFDEEKDLYLEQRAMEFERLYRELLAGRLSPVAFFAEYYHMNVKDLAARLKIRPAKVRRHMTVEGFAEATVGMLLDYARIFDVTVGDFFCFTHVAEGLEAKAERHGGRLIQKIEIASGGAA